MEHPFPHGSSHIEFAMARGEIDHWLPRITTDVARTIRFYMDFLYRAFAHYLEDNAVFRLLAQAPIKAPPVSRRPKAAAVVGQAPCTRCACSTTLVVTAATP